MLSPVKCQTTINSTCNCQIHGLDKTQLDSLWQRGIKIIYIDLVDFQGSVTDFYNDSDALNQTFFIDSILSKVEKHGLLKWVFVHPHSQFILGYPEDFHQVSFNILYGQYVENSVSV